MSARGGDALSAERAAALAQIGALTREFDEVVAASKASNADDEHDPEGATIAFERQQVAALLESTRARLADVEAALARRADGGQAPYGVYTRVLESGDFTELPGVGSMRLLRRDR